MILWERDPNLFYRYYILGEPGFDSKYMRLGKRLAKARERLSDPDPTIDFLAKFMPQYPKHEYKMEVEFEGIPLQGKFDGWNPWSKIIGEDKSGKNFTQGMADKLGQLTMYSTIVWKSKGYFPSLRLHWAKTIEENGVLRFTGEFRTFETTRTLKDIILFSKRIKTAWSGICEMRDELL